MRLTEELFQLSSSKMIVKNQHPWLNSNHQVCRGYAIRGMEIATYCVASNFSRNKVKVAEGVLLPINLPVEIPALFVVKLQLS